MVVGLEELLSVWEAGTRGDFREHSSFLATRGRPDDDPWAFAFTLQMHCAVPDRVAAPRVGSWVQRVGDESHALAVGLSAHLAVRTNLANLPLVEMVEVTAREHASVAQYADATRAWHALRRSDLVALRDALDRLKAHAKDPRLIVEQTGLRAIAAEWAGEPAQALKLARRASRMARTEARPQQEYFVNLVLARQRRLNGTGYLALRILGALRKLAPRHWRPWLEWEFACAGGPAGAHGSSQTQAEDASTLRTLIIAAQSGNRPEFDRTASQLTHSEDWYVRSDIDVLLPLLDPNRSVTGVGAKWVRGEVDDVPGGFAGIARACNEREVAYACGPHQGRRVLTPGQGLLDHTTVLESADSARCETAIALLLITGQMELDAWFERLYGFPYVPELHRNPRNVLIHRARQLLEKVGGELRLEGRSIELAVPRGLAVRDPRCALGADYEVLALLAREGTTSASDAAAMTGLPRRTVARALHRLMTDGVCRSERDGRKLVFVVEDTTYSEPTQPGMTL